MPFLLIFGPIFGVCAFAAFVAHGHKTLALASAAKSAAPPVMQHFELDHGMPEALAHQVLDALVLGQDPAQLQALAHELGTKFPIAASELSAKAATLGGSGVAAAAPSPSHSPSPPHTPSHAADAAAAPSVTTGPDLGDAALILQAAMKAYAEETDPVPLEGFAESIRAKYPTAAILLVGRAHELRAAQIASDAANAPHVPGPAGSPTPLAGEPLGGAAQAPAAVAAAPPPAAIAPPPMKLATYVVQAGDSPSAIAERFTRDGKRWPELVAANPGKPLAHDGSFQSMRQGETLTLPSTWASSPVTHTQPNAHATEAHP